MNKEDIYQVVEESVTTLNFVPLEIVINYGQTKDVLKIVIHHTERKITSEDCALVADIISRRLDINDPFERPYDLIVESPGVDRELKSLKEYPFFIGELFKVFIIENENFVTKEGFLIGTLTSIDEKSITLQIENEDNGTIIPLDTIKKSKLYCDYTKLLKKNK